MFAFTFNKYVKKIVSCRNILFISAMQRLSHLFTSRKSERGKEINKLISKLQESS